MKKITALFLFPACLWGLPFEPALNQGFAIFITIAWLWISEALPLPVTALLVPVLAGSLGVLSVGDALANFAHPIIFIFFGGFTLAAALQKQGLDRRLAHSVVRFGRGHFLTAALLLFSMTAFLSMWVSNTATAAMMLPLALGLLNGQRASVRMFLLLGLAYSASLGGIGTLVGSPPNAIAAAALELDFIGWTKLGLPLALLLLPCCWVTLYLLFQPRANKLTNETREQHPLSRKDWQVILTFVLIAGLWIFSRPISNVIGVEKYLDAIIALAAVLLLSMGNVLSWEEIQKKTEWGVLILFGGGLALSAVLKASGASTFMADQLALAVTDLPYFAILLAIILFVVFLTELASNTATAALLVPVFIEVASHLGISAPPLIMAIGVAASCAFMLPVATPPNAIVYGSGQVPQRTMMKTGLVLNLVIGLILSIYIYCLT